MATPFDIAKIVNLLEAAYPNWLIRKNEQQIDLVNEVYYQDLKMFDTALLESAVTRCRRSKEHKDFAPSVGAIRAACMDILREVEGIPSDLEAWDEVCNMPHDFKKSRITGEFDTDSGLAIIETKILEWTHPLVGKVARMLGFPDFPKVKNGRFENEMTDRAHFFTHYESAVNSYLEQKTEHPVVAGFIKSGKQLALNDSNSAIKQLAKGMAK